jgi:hypothetical protein
MLTRATNVRKLLSFYQDDTMPREYCQNQLFLLFLLVTPSSQASVRSLAA